MGYSTSRLISYALLSAIEEDLRNIVEEYLSPIDPKSLLGEIEYERALVRFKKDSVFLGGELSLSHILAYTDFAPLVQIITSNKQQIPPHIFEVIVANKQRLERLFPIRNRVAHSRPLLYDDFPNLSDACAVFERSQSEIWSNLRLTLGKLRESPSFIMDLSIPEWEEEETAIYNNLPLPDFDETGFFGRKKQIDDITRHCRGSHPVITIVGEGGIGKTALALRVAYDLLDNPNNPFDAIIWTSSKTSQLTKSEITNIQGAISSSIGMFRDIASTLGSDAEAIGPLEEILEYMREFKILLIMDNIETVLDENIVAFLENLPHGSKVIITSRIGIGSMELRYALTSMDPTDSVHYLRALLRIRGQEKTIPIDDAHLQRYCGQMKYNPGFIKWFVSVIQTGKRPEEILAKPDTFLDFCMTNVYHFLSQDSKKVIRSMLCLPKSHNTAELAYLNELGSMELQPILYELLRTPMVIRNYSTLKNSGETTYELSDLSRQYLIRKYSPTKDEFDYYITRNRRLIATGEDFLQNRNEKPYSYFNISPRSTRDYAVGKILLDSLLSAIKFHQFDVAEKHIEEAKRLAPEYYEVYRVEAIVLNKKGNISGAQQSFLQAIDIQPDYAPLRYWYGNFLLEDLNDPENAINEFLKANSIDPKSVDVKYGLARSYLYSGQFSESSRYLKELTTDVVSDRKLLRRIYDLIIECHNRNIEGYYVNHEFQRLPQLYNDLIVVCRTCPVDLIDSKMKAKLVRAIGIAEEAQSIAGSTELKVELGSIINQLEQLQFFVAGDQKKYDNPEIVSSGSHRQEGVIRSIKKSYGFLSTVDGVDYFFHQSEVSQDDWVKLHGGLKVTFIPNSVISEGKLPEAKFVSLAF